MTHNENQMGRLSEPGVTTARGSQRTCAGPGGHAVGGRHGHAVEPQQRQKLLRKVEMPAQPALSRGRGHTFGS